MPDLPPLDDPPARTPPETLPRRQIAAVALLLALATAGLAVRPIDDPDYHWHLQTGRYLAQHREVPSRDVFSHTYRGKPWRLIDWAADLAMYGLHRAGGEALTTLFFALLGGLALGLTCWFAAGRVGPHGALALLLVGVLVLAATLFRITPRPQTAVPLFLAVELLLLDAAARHRRWLVAVPLLVLVWVNVHSVALVGVLVMGAWATGATIDWRRGRGDRAVIRPAWLATGASILAFLVAPHPLGRLEVLLQTATDRRIPALITEYQPLWRLEEPWVPAALAVLALLALGGVATRRGPSRPLTWEVLVALGLGLMGLMAVRFAPLAAIGLVPLAARGAANGLAELERWRAVARIRPWLLGLGVLAAATLVLPQARWPATGLAPDAFPVGAASFLANHPLRGRLYNDFYFGGYLLHRLDAAHPVFIDGRMANVYDADLLVQVARGDTRTLQRFIRQYGLGIAVCALDARADWFQVQPDWSLVYFDDTTFVAVRNAGNEALVARHAYRHLRPARPVAGLGGSPADPAGRAAAAAEVARARREAPRAALPEVLAAEQAAAAGDYPAAEAALALALHRRPGFVPALQSRLTICVRQQQRDCACAASRDLLAADLLQIPAIQVFTALGCAGP